MRLKEIIDTFLFRIGITPKKAGWTSFSPLKIVPEYTVDLEKGQVTGVVKHNGKVYLTVIVDIPNDKTEVKGSLRGIGKLTKPFKKQNYIEIIKNEAEYFIQNKITNPKEFYDKLRS
ncbi:hypothetical protein J7E63_16020 [Bacillus sp. ISL-75]|uniref:hypothetical protein n=1 Tax=Bacillus sp. ISL-75 TaxID=2819137 RepID=UPI001BECE761|nr:hypothetical protein [Bacillus sp. ISL-75]MBT2728435.1 hypothetical protein [Bacillus sp. ISL-75]